MKSKFEKIISAFTAALVSPTLLSATSYAADADVARIENVARILINILVGFGAIVAVAAIVLGGIKMSTSAGNPQKLDGAKSTIFWGGAGLVVCLLAFVIVSAVSNAVNGS